MQDKIKQIRVTIDGLAKLTDALEEHLYVFPSDSIPQDMSLEDFYQRIKNIPISVVKETTPTIQIHSRKVGILGKGHLLIADAWLCKVLQELETENLSQDVNNTSLYWCRLEDESVKALYAENFEQENDDPSINIIEKLDWLRTEIEKVVQEVSSMQFLHGSRELNIARTNCYNHLCEAKFQLGFELGKIKEAFNG